MSEISEKYEEIKFKKIFDYNYYLLTQYIVAIIILPSFVHAMLILIITA